MKSAVVYLLLGAALGGLLAGTLAEPVYENTFCKQQRCPYDGDFQCKTSGRCLRPWSVCNGYSNCRDGSDEENCGTPNFGCYGYLCDNRARCLSYSSVCNGRASCLDDSDEGNCLSRSCPYDGDFKCNDGRCVRSRYICDGYSNCPSGEDEENCGSTPCPLNGYFRCGTGECINPVYTCNRFNNCRDGSDEINCTYNDECPYNGDIKCNSRCYRSHQFCYYYQRCTSNTTTNCSTMSCPYHEDFRCPLSGICIRSYEVCDGYNNCRNGEDEENCTSVNCRYGEEWCGEYETCFYPYHHGCSILYRCGYNCSYSCVNSTQISYYSIISCNGINDCADGSDETNCYNSACIGVNDFRCQSTGACIRQAKVCDGIVHCSDRSDETNCTTFSCPIPGDVKCRNDGICIHYDKICDGKNDCLDGSDEENCALRSCPYSDDRRCKSSQACIRADSWCNNILDCMDESDEEDCYDKPCPYAGDFHCGYGYCVRSSYVCNGYENCLDGSDEGMNYCPEVFTLGIHWERTLTNTTNTHKCSDIHPSFKLSDVITRECLRNRTWAPVNISQCVMSSDSPVVLIVIVSLDTNSSSLVKSRQDNITQELKEMIIEQPAVDVETIQSVSNANVSLKITFEFSTIRTTEELMGNIKYNMNVTTLGNISVATAPQLTIFESTDVCQCPDSIKLSTASTGANGTESIDLVSVCSGKPCEYSSSSNFISQCAASFAGDGRICGKDSDGDGYPDMELNCNDTHCTQDNCPNIHNPNQNLEACNGTQLQATTGKSDDDGMSIATAVGITFSITLIISILFTLMIVYIVYKIKQSTANNKPLPVSAVVNTASLPRGDSTIKATGTAGNDDYEYPENYKSRVDETRYQKNPSTPMQPNPAYGMEAFDKNDSTPVYENFN